jgi:hypothetical protein
MVAAPAAAAADVIFDPADADELAATLKEASDAQDVCYGWEVRVDDAVAGASQSVGSNFGAGKPVGSGSCSAEVVFHAYITYTSESSESEDSASYDVTSSPGGPTRDDLAALELDLDGLTGEDPDAVVGKAVAALPLLAADKGMAKAIEAAPETADAPADAALTDDPGSDWWRANGGVFLWGIGLLLAGGAFAWWVIRSSKVRWTPPNRRRPAPVEQVPTYIPSDFYEQDAAQEPVLAPKPETSPTAVPIEDPKPKSTVAPEPEPKPKPDATPAPVEPEPETAAEPPPATAADTTVTEGTPATEAAPPVEESTSDQAAQAAQSEKDTGPSDQKDKE